MTTKLDRIAAMEKELAATVAELAALKTEVEAESHPDPQVGEVRENPIGGFPCQLGSDEVWRYITPGGCGMPLPAQRACADYPIIGQINDILAHWKATKGRLPITPKTGEDRPDITQNSVWRMRDGKPMVIQNHTHGRLSTWRPARSLRIITSYNARDFRGDGVLDYELVEYIGQLEDIVSFVLGGKR